MNANAEQMGGMLVCGNCQTTNAQGGKFCKGCGKLLAPGIVPPQFRQKIPSMAGGGAPVTFGLPMDAASAFSALSTSVQQSGGQLVGQTPPHALFFEVPYKNMMVSFTKLAFDGQASIQPTGANASQISMSLKLKSSSLGSMAGVYVVTLIMLLVMQMPVLIVLLVAIGSVGYAYWTLTSQAPGTLAGQIQSALAMHSGANSFGGAQAAYSEPRTAPPPPVNNTPPPNSAPHAAAGPSPIEQITRLAELRKLGAISDAEFEAKKTELLARV